MENLALFLDFLLTSFLLLGPMLLIGLFLAGVIHVLISRDAVPKWLRHHNLKSVVSSAAIGVPIPLCSCSVVPVVTEMRRKGASRSSCMSFLITAPETGADSILVTNAFFGPVAAAVRPIVSFVTGVAAGIFSIGVIREEDPERVGPDRNCGNCREGEGHETLIPGDDDCYVSPAAFRIFFLTWLADLKNSVRRLPPMTRVMPQRDREFPVVPEIHLNSRPAGGHRIGGPSFGAVCRHVLRYGFVEIADDILLALLVGVVLGGVLYLAIPGDLMAREYAIWLSYPAMVLVGIPLYICASASTPIAAALVAAGFSPGAALIFLMTGPATNTGTIAIVASQFGTRFASVYVGSVITVTLALGIALDLLMIAFGLTLQVNLGASDSPALMTFQWVGAIGLFALMFWRFRAGAFGAGYRQLISVLSPASRHR